MAYTALTSKVAGDVFTEAMWTNLKDNFDAMRGNGSVSAPSVTFDSDTNTGLYRIAEDRLGVTTAGTKALEVAADGKLLFGNATDTNLYRSAADTLKTDDAFEAASIKSGNVSLAALTNVVQTTVDESAGIANSQTFADVTTAGQSLAVTITPTFSTSKVLVTAVFVVGGSASMAVGARILRGATPIGLGATAGSRTLMGSSVDIDGAAEMNPMTLMILDSPATTSATTYKVQLNAQSTGTCYINRTGTDTDSTSYYRTASFIIVQEIPV